MSKLFYKINIFSCSHVMYVKMEGIILAFWHYFQDAIIDHMDIRIEQKRRCCATKFITSKLVIWLTSQLNHNIHNLSCTGAYCAWSLYYLCPNSKQRSFHQKPWYWQKPIRAENYFRKYKSNRNTGGTTSAKTMWTMWLKSIQDSSVTGYKYTFTFDDAEDVLVVKFANKQDIKQWCWKTLPEDIRKMQRISARKEYVSMDRPEICEVARHYNRQCFRCGKIAVIRTLLRSRIRSDRLLLFIPSTHTVGSRWELNKKLYNALAFALYPYFYGFSSDGVDIVATRNRTTVQEEHNFYAP